MQPHLNKPNRQAQFEKAICPLCKRHFFTDSLFLINADNFLNIKISRCCWSASYIFVVLKYAGWQICLISPFPAELSDVILYHFFGRVNRENVNKYCVFWKKIENLALKIEFIGEFIDCYFGKYYHILRELMAGINFQNNHQNWKNERKTISKRNLKRKPAKKSWRRSTSRLNLPSIVWSRRDFTFWQAHRR